MEKIEQQDAAFFAKPEVGTTLTVMSGLSFLVMMMILPLVGPAGAATVHYQQNFITFLSVNVLTAALSLTALFSKLARRKIDASPWPLFSSAVLGVTLLFMVAALGGLLKI